MQAKGKTEFEPCIPGVLPGGLSRTRFFDGMFLTQKDLEREQVYNRMKRRLTNRALGQGVVWGLRLQWDARTRRFSLGPGYALDCCGNDLVVECPQEMSERQLVDKSDPAVRALIAGEGSPTARCPTSAEDDGPRKACIVLQYVECPEEPRPVHQDACTSNVTHCEYSTVRESTRLLLVPPPAPGKPSPVDEFCESLEALRQECEAAGMDCNLFFPEPQLSNSSLHTLVRVQETVEAPPAPDGVMLRPGTTAGDTVDETLDTVNEPANLHVWIEPEPGYVFLEGTVTDAAGDSFTMLPFGLDGDVQADAANAPLSFTVENLVISPLFGGGQEYRVKLVFSINPVTSPQPGVELQLVTETVESWEREMTACTRLFSPAGLINGDPLCVTKTLVLGIVYGWLRGMLGTEKEESALGQAAAPPSRQLLAWWILQLSWRLLFRADLNADDDGKLADLLKKLFSDWCARFVYPGPRCSEDHHGVFLGCIEISSKGNVICFDPWEHRRHVLTGPLLAHWGGQFGLAPIDVVASRFVRWICCVKDSKEVVAPGTGVTAGVALEQAIALNSAGTALYAGSNAASFLAQRGLSVVGQPQSVDIGELGGELLKALLQSETGVDPERVKGRRLYSVPGQNLHLFVPAEQAYGAVGRQGASASFSPAVDRLTAEVRPLARNPVGDFLRVLSSAIGLGSLRVPEDNVRFEPFVETINTTGVSSIADYLALGPEAGAERVLALSGSSDAFATTEDVYIAAEEVFDAAETFVERAAKPLVEAANETEGPFLRTNLADEELIKTTRRAATTSLKRNRLTTTAMTDIAAKVIAMRPA